MANWPTSITTFPTLEDNVDFYQASHVNMTTQELSAVMTSLGVGFTGSSSTMKSLWEVNHLLSGNHTSISIVSTGTAANVYFIAGKMAGDNRDRFYIDGNSGLWWGGGTVSADISLLIQNSGTLLLSGNLGFTGSYIYIGSINNSIFRLTENTLACNINWQVGNTFYVGSTDIYIERVNSITPIMRMGGGDFLALNKLHVGTSDTYFWHQTNNTIEAKASFIVASVFFVGSDCYIEKTSAANWHSNVGFTLDGVVYSRTTAIGNTGISTALSGDSYYRFLIQGGGGLWWGAGNAVQETTIYRNSSGWIRTNGGLILDSGFLYIGSLNNAIYRDSGNTIAFQNMNLLLLGDTMFIGSRDTWMENISGASTLRVNKFMASSYYYIGTFDTYFYRSGATEVTMSIPSTKLVFSTTTYVLQITPEMLVGNWNASGISYVSSNMLTGDFEGNNSIMKGSNTGVANFAVAPLTLPESATITGVQLWAAAGNGEYVGVSIRRYPKSSGTRDCNVCSFYITNSTGSPITTTLSNNIITRGSRYNMVIKALYLSDVSNFFCAEVYYTMTTLR